jgi:hypothetical protein
MGIIRATEEGVLSAVRLWFVLHFGDEDEDGREEGREDEVPAAATDGEGGRAGGRKGQTVLDSRETHWKYAVFYLPEACFKEGERVPLMCIRAGREGGRERGRGGREAGGR